jgi:hypothetical protein
MRANSSIFDSLIREPLFRVALLFLTFAAALAGAADHVSASLQSLRLLGYTAIDKKITAYFTDNLRGNVFTLREGETSPDGLHLVRIENTADASAFCAVLQHGNTFNKVYCATQPSPFDFSNPVPAIAAPTEPSSERVAVKPWVDPNKK